MALLAKGFKTLASSRVDLLYGVVGSEDEASVAAVLALPVSEAAIGQQSSLCVDGVRPLLLAGSCIQRDDVILLRQGVQGIADDERIEGVVSVVPGGDAPHRLQLHHIAAVHLFQ